MVVMTGSRCTKSSNTSSNMWELVGDEKEAGPVQQSPTVSSCSPPLKPVLYWINVGLGVRVGRGNLNKGRCGEGGSQPTVLSESFKEFWASVFVGECVCLGLILTSCETWGAETYTTHLHLYIMLLMMILVMSAFQMLCSFFMKLVLLTCGPETLSCSVISLESSKSLCGVVMSVQPASKDKRSQQVCGDSFSPHLLTDFWFF